jgi:rhodanese-related sulfurtransferase
VVRGFHSLGASGRRIGQNGVQDKGGYGSYVVSTQRHPPNGKPALSKWGSLERLVEEAAQRITRLAAPEAFSAAAAGGVIIDIRSQDARELYGVIPGSLHIARTVLEWRVAVDSPWRNRHLGGLDQQLILVCDHGYSSILAAGNLVELGFNRAGDVIGGFEAWAHERLPIGTWQSRLSAADALPGTGPPE